MGLMGAVQRSDHGSWGCLFLGLMGRAAAQRQGIRRDSIEILWHPACRASSNGRNPYTSIWQGSRTCELPRALLYDTCCIPTGLTLTLLSDARSLHKA